MVDTTIKRLAVYGTLRSFMTNSEGKLIENDNNYARMLKETGTYEGIGYAPIVLYDGHHYPIGIESNEHTSVVEVYSFKDEDLFETMLNILDDYEGAAYDLRQVNVTMAYDDRLLTCLIYLKNNNSFWLRLDELSIVVNGDWSSKHGDKGS